MKLSRIVKPLPENMAGDTLLEREVNALLTQRVISTVEAPDDEFLDVARELIALVQARTGSVESVLEAATSSDDGRYGEAWNNVIRALADEEIPQGIPNADKPEWQGMNREQLRALMERDAQAMLGLSAAEAYRAIDEGKLDDTVAKIALENLRWLEDSLPDESSSSEGE